MDQEDCLVRRYILICIQVSVIILSLEIMFMYLINPWLKIRYISFSSEINYTKNELLNLTSLNKNIYYYSLGLDSYLINFKDDLRVDSIILSRVFPNKIKIKIKKKRAVAVTCAFDELKNKMIYYTISEDGVIIEKRESLKDDLVFISEFDLSDCQTGDYLEPEVIDIVTQIGHLKYSDIAMYNQISEIVFLKLNFYDYVALLYINGICGEILINPDTDLKWAIESVDKMNDLIKANNYKIDLRSGDVVLMEKL